MQKLFLLSILLSCFVACNSKTEEKNDDSEATSQTAIAPLKRLKTAGLILPIVDSLRYRCNYGSVLSPETGFTVYDKPNGKAIGKVKLEPKEGDSQSFYDLHFISGTHKQLVAPSEYYEIAYALFAISYNDMIDGYVRVFDSRKNHWLKIDEIKREGFTTVNWTNFLIKESMTDSVIGYYANEPGLKLRKEPNANSDVICTIRGEFLAIKLSEKVSGQWCYATIVKYRELPCETIMDEEKNIEYKKTGWVKIIDDNGAPNIWSFTGC